MPNYNYHCTYCEEITIHNFPSDKRPKEAECEICGEMAEYRIAAANLVYKEAYIDGTKRKGFAEMREASKLNREMSTKNTDAERKRVAGEIKRLGVRVRKEGE